MVRCFIFDRCSKTDSDDLAQTLLLRRFSNDFSSTPEVSGRFQETTRKDFAWLGEISTNGSSIFSLFNFTVEYGKSTTPSC